MTIRQFLGRAVRPANSVLRRAGVQIVRHGPRPFEEWADYIPFAPTVAAAAAAGMSVGDYIEGKHNVAGVTQDTIERLQALGALHQGIRRICEIGPGSGRYLERTIKACRPDHYEIYETSTEWRDYVVAKYGVVAHPVDGRSLSPTPSASIDLVQAHKVIPGFPFLVACRYFGEFARAVVPGGKVVFDTVTEACMEEPTLAQWLGAGAAYQQYPNLMPRQYIVDFFARRGLSLDGSFIVTMKPGLTECLVFTRSGS